MIIIKRPIVTILIGVLIGIICGLYLNLSIALIVILTAFSIIFIYNYKIKQLSKILKDVFLTLFISIIISNLYINFLNQKYEQFYKKVPNNVKTTATVISEAKETEYYYSYNIKVDSKKFILLVSKSYQQKLEFGMCISLKAEYIKPDIARNYKGFNYKEYLKNQKIYGTFKAQDIKVIKQNNINIISNFSNKVRNKIIDTTKNILPDKTRGLLIGILIGERQDISEELTESFSKSSLSHIVAISGSHISYIILGITYVLSKSRIHKKVIYIITILALVLFMFITNFSPSIIRACIMGIIMLFSKLVYRKPDILASIAVSLLIILASNPFSIRDIGLQLSYMGTLGIIYFNKPISNFLNRYISRKISDIISITISAQIMVLPIMILNFNSISTVFLISNIVAVPLSGAIILFGYLNVFLGFLSINLAKLLAICTHGLVQILIWTAEFTAKLPFSSMAVVTPSYLTLIAYYLLLFCIYKRKYIKQVVVVFLVLIIIITASNVFPKNFKIHFVDVGQRRLYINKDM